MHTGPKIILLITLHCEIKVVDRFENRSRKDGWMDASVKVGKVSMTIFFFDLFSAKIRHMSSAYWLMAVIGRPRNSEPVDWLEVTT